MWCPTLCKTLDSVENEIREMCRGFPESFEVDVGQYFEVPEVPHS
jgi:hypothetical protein